MQGRPYRTELSINKEKPVPGVELDYAGKPKSIECKNANGRLETFKRVGVNSKGEDMWSINGAEAMPMKVKMDSNGTVTLEHQSKEWQVTHTVKGGVRSTATRHC